MKLFSDIMESSDDSAPENWEDEAEEATKEEVETWVKTTSYVFKTSNDDEYTLSNYSSLVNIDSQLSQHYTMKKETGPKENPQKKENTPKAKPEIPLVKIDKSAMIEELTGTIYSASNVKPTINIVFIGHVDAGKSTLCGHLLLKCNKIEPRVVEQYELEAKENNRESWWLAYIMDVNEDEREKGITIEVGRAFLDTTNRVVCILDAPGHKSYVPNMLLAAAQADLAALVVSARPGEFESGFQKGGQTTEHILLSRSMGIDCFIILVTKMDTVEWDESRFNYIKNSMLPFLLETCKILEHNLIWIPISGINGGNLIRSGACQWYTGPDFLSVLDICEVPIKDIQGPLRIPIFDKAKDQGLVLLGKVESGVIVKGMKIVIMPGNFEADVVDLMGVEDCKIVYAESGMNIRIRVKGSDEIKPGMVICDAYDLVNVCEEFLADVMFLDLVAYKPLILPGYTCMIHIGVAVAECTIQNIISKFDEATKKKVKVGFCKANTRAIVRIQVKELMCIEKFSTFKPLGRFTLRDEDNTIGLGKILDIFA